MLPPEYATPPAGWWESMGRGLLWAWEWFQAGVDMLEGLGILVDLGEVLWTVASAAAELLCLIPGL